MTLAERPRRRPRRHARWFWPAVIWILALGVAAATWVVRVPFTEAMDADPTVGSGRLEARETGTVPAAVLDALPDARPIDPDVLAARLAAIPNPGGGDIVGVVLDGRTGTELTRLGAGGTRTPASSMKVLSGVVALDVLGPGTTFPTTALLAPDGSLVLRGGGDPLLTSSTSPDYPHPASLEQLAAATAAALTRRGVTQVRLGYDASLFGGPGWNPAWPDIFASSVAPITALTADHARIAPPSYERSPDPARFAAERFADALRAHGVEVTAIDPMTTPAGADELAHVDSLPVRTLVEQSLTNSDNDAAETLAWQVALARGVQPTPSSAAATLRTELTRLGLWSDGMAALDGNGIATDNQVTPDALAGAIELGLQRDDLRAVITGLPVGAVSGTLAERFEAPDALAGRGTVRAKTGTIRGVNTLTGYVVTTDGQPLVFAFMVSGGAGQTSARAWLDQASATLASCGC